MVADAHPRPAGSAVSDRDRPKALRCAVYCRVSSDDRLEQDFNSLHNQRGCGEAYIKSQNWICLPEAYDDPGFTGANTDRPALQRLLADIQAGGIDCVIVQRVDRLTRSLMDFHRIIELFDRHGVCFVSATQPISSANSMGRLMLNVLLSFAQFERELISDRTKDKLLGARRKGKWTGGRPILGYNLVAGTGGSRLVINPDEAERVREIFQMYLDSRAGLTTVVTECSRRGWTTKAWTTKAGMPHGGKPLDKNQLYALLRNVVYAGLVRHHEDVYPGEHEAIISRDIFDAVQAKMKTNGRTGGSHVRNTSGALLKGLVRCGACQCAMTHTFASRAGSNGKAGRRYRYYSCQRALKHGHDACPEPSVPAGDLEGFVIDTLRETLTGPAAVHAVAERAMAILAETGGRRVVDPDEVIGAAETFDPVWESMTQGEKEALVRALVHEVVFDGVKGTVSVTFAEGVHA